LLERVVDNLLLNASEHAPQGSEVQVRMHCDEGRIHLAVGNAAPELEERDLERMGERFWRKSPAREASRHGGLGLALARSLAVLLRLQLEFRLENGWLWAELGGLSSLQMPE
jgi:two-component system sensor histidine kinase QseC